MANYEYSTRDARGITYEDPLNPNSTLRATRSVNPKTVSGLKLTNVKSEVVVVRQVDPRPADCTDCAVVLEPFSVRISISGSPGIAAEEEKALASAIKFAWENRAILMRGSLPSSEAVIVIDPVITVTTTP